MLNSIGPISMELFSSRDCDGTHFDGPDLSGADLQSANLDETGLRGTDLSRVKGLTSLQLKKAIIDKKTLLPEYLELNWLSDTEWEVKERPKPWDKD